MYGTCAAYLLREDFAAFLAGLAAFDALAGALPFAGALSALGFAVDLDAGLAAAFAGGFAAPLVFVTSGFAALAGAGAGAEAAELSLKIRTRSNPSIVGR